VSNFGKFIFFTSLSLLLTAGIFFGYKNLFGIKKDKILASSRKASILVYVHDKEDKLLWSFLMEYFPKEKRLGMFFINPLVTFYDNGTTLEEENSLSTLEGAIQDALGFLPNFKIKIKIENIGRAIDLFGGLDLFMDPRTHIESERYNRRKMQHYLLDGEDLVDFAKSMPDSKTLSYVQRLDRQESITISFLESLRETKEGIPKFWIFFLHQQMDTSISSKDLEVAIDLFKKERLHLGISEVPAEPTVRSRDKKEILRAKLDTVRVAHQNFINDLRSSYYSDGDRARIEVLNGTSKNGLAKYGKSLLNEKRLKVLAVSNAWDNNFEKSVILNRSGNTSYSDQISEVFQGRKVYHSLRKDLGLDATVVLGNDFQGSR